MDIPNHPGLAGRLHAAGIMVETRHYADRPAETVVSDAAAAQAIVDAYTLADAAAHVCSEIVAHAAALRDRAVSGTSPGEMASWPIKRAEALAYQVDTAAATPMLAAEAAARMVPIASIVERVLHNAAALGGLEAAIAGVSGRHRDAINACESYAQIAAYAWHSGWPEL